MKISNVGWLASVLFVSVCAQADGRHDLGSDLNPIGGLVDSAREIALDAVIADGVLLSRSPATSYSSEIRQQLFYLVGQLNELDGAPQLGKLQISVGATEPLHDGNGMVRVHYAAKLMIAWSRLQPVPAVFEAVLPARGDSAGLADFFGHYGSSCAESSGTPDIENFWYHFRPSYSACALSRASSDETNHAVRAAMQLKVSGANSEGKSPEYGKMWEDGKLVVTIVVGKYTPGSTEDYDAGTSVFNDIYNGLLAKYGKPGTINDHFDGSPGHAHPSLEMTFKLRSGPLDLALYLVDKLADAGPDFVKKYNARTLVSDLVIYNGHAGLGANVRAMSHLGKFAPGKYQLFMVNGCDSFAYADDSLFKAHAAANPGSAPTKYMDLITNAMPAYFNSMDGATMALLDSIDEKHLTYRDLLAEFDDAQRALVVGEEDNLWPKPF